jgi:hypothetical protein
MKNFLRPTILKIIVALFLFVSVSYIVDYLFGIDIELLDYPSGFPGALMDLFLVPLPVLIFKDYYPKIYGEVLTTTSGTVSLNWLNLLIDLVFWYLISCFIVWIFSGGVKRIGLKLFHLLLFIFSLTYTIQSMKLGEWKLFGVRGKGLPLPYSFPCEDYSNLKCLGFKCGACKPSFNFIFFLADILIIFTGLELLIYILRRIVTRRSYK